MKLPGLMISPSSKVKVSRSFFAAGESARITEVCRTVRYRASSTAAVANAPIVQAQKTTARPRTPHQHVEREYNRCRNPAGSPPAA